ncbi:MAG: phosphatase PAP2 family protein [Tatlockia sp.]
MRDNKLKRQRVTGNPLIFQHFLSGNLINLLTLKRQSTAPLLNVSSFTLVLAALLLLFTSTAFIVNQLHTQFPGNNYLPPSFVLNGLILLFLGWGVYLWFGQSSHAFRLAREFIYFFLVVVVVGLTTNAAQYTPFEPIDRHIIAMDRFLGINLSHLMEWTTAHPLLKQMLAWSYRSLPVQMCYIPFLLIIAGKFTVIREYYALILLTTLIGFSVYYFFPTLGPASAVESAFFIQEQQATGLKFTEIHNHIAPSTSEGGLIAMPSFHTIWAWLCLYSLRCWPLAFVALFPLTFLLVCSCVLLGWHYGMDIVASVLILSLSHWIYWRINNSHWRIHRNQIK